MIPHSKPWITEEDVHGVQEIMSSGMLAQGSIVKKVENRLGSWFTAGAGVAVGSGSAALVLALRGLNVVVGDEVIVPTYVCRSVVEAVLTLGGTPVLCDVGTNWVMSSPNVAPHVSNRTKAIIVPHLYGLYADVQSILPFGVPIIEDFAQAFPGRRSRTIEGDIGILSFHPTKCLTAGEGGMVLSRNLEFLDRIRRLRDGEDGSCLPRSFSPLSDLSAGLLDSQLNRYDLGLRKRSDIAHRYIEAVKKISPTLLSPLLGSTSMFFRFPLRVRGGLGFCEERFASRGIQVRRGVDQLLHRLLGLPDDQFMIAVSHFDSTVSIPIYPAMTSPETDRCAEAISEVLRESERLPDDERF